MIYGHLERFEIILNTLSPVFIGSGKEISKKEYIFDKPNKVIHVPDLAKLVDFLSKRSLLSKFEEFLLKPRTNDLYSFLSENRITRKDYPNFVLYSIDAGEVAYSEKFRGVQTFIKGADGRPYIPGSSLKGIIRTAIAAQLLNQGNHRIYIENIERAAEDYRGNRNYISKETNQLENRLFCNLEIRDPYKPDKIKWDSIQNDFMRGISISDSQPIDVDSLTLCGKYDRHTDGRINPLPIYRECLAPGTKIRFVMTLDRPILKKAGIDRLFIEEALRNFALAHKEDYEQFFCKLKEDADKGEVEGIPIILGGGAGYASKTLTYPLVRDRKRTLKLVSTILSKQYRNHNHGKDVSHYKVSPHILKTTLYKGKFYQMGRCELLFK